MTSLHNSANRIHYIQWRSSASLFDSVYRRRRAQTQQNIVDQDEAFLTDKTLGVYVHVVVAVDVVVDVNGFWDESL